MWHLLVYEFVVGGQEAQVQVQGHLDGVLIPALWGLYNTQIPNIVSS